MAVSSEKSSFLYQNVDEETHGLIASFLPYSMAPITSGFKYLGFHLKPMGYISLDWIWMVKMFENRIKSWTYRLLSIGG